MYKSLENFLLNFLQILHPSLVEQLSNILYLRNKNVINNNFTCKKNGRYFPPFLKFRIEYATSKRFEFSSVQISREKKSFNQLKRKIFIIQWREKKKNPQRLR